MKYTVFWHDGESMWCARTNMFTTPLESPEGFGNTPVEALQDLLELMDK